MYFGNNDLSLPQFKPGGNNNKNQFQWQQKNHFSSSKKIRIIFFNLLSISQRILEKTLTYYHILTQIFNNFEIALFATIIWKLEISDKVFQTEKHILQLNNKNICFLCLSCPSAFFRFLLLPNLDFILFIFFSNI